MDLKSKSTLQVICRPKAGAKAPNKRGEKYELWNWDIKLVRNLLFTVCKTDFEWSRKVEVEEPIKLLELPTYECSHLPCKCIKMISGHRQ